MPHAADQPASASKLGVYELDAIYETAPVGLCVLDTDLRFVRINTRLAEINGIPVADHIGRTVREIVPHLADDVEPLLRRILDTGEPLLNLEIQGETAAQPGVERTWIESWYPLEDRSGRVVGINIVAEEITERQRAEQAVRKSEERFLTALRHSPVVFAHVDPELRYEWIFNPHPDVDPTGFVGKRDDELQPDAGGEAMLQLKRRVLEHGRQERQQIALERSDGRRWYDVTATPVHDRDGRIVRIVTASIDITEQKKAERALQELTETLAARVRERTARVRELASALTMAEQTERRRVARVLHDDLQQQLYAAQLPLEMLARDMDQEARPERAANVARAFDAVADAIRTTRHLMVDLSPPVLKGEGLPEALQWLAAQMQRRFGLEVTLGGTDRLPVPQDDMRVLLFQTVRELLFNVVKYARTDRAHVSLVEDGAELCIRISDDGAGFDPARFDAAAPQDAGFGLRHARERLALFGGRMEVDTRPGDGTRIALFVPLASLQQPSW